MPKPQKIDLEGIAQRVISLPVPMGIYDRIVGLDGDRAMWVSFQSRSRRVGFGDAVSEMDSEDEDDEHAGKITVFNLKTLHGKNLEVDEPVFDLVVACGGRFMAILTQDDDGDLSVFVSRAGEEPGSAAADDDAEDEDERTEFGPLTGAVDIDGRVVLQAQPTLEWPQLFNEAWRAVRDGYAEPTMGGVDWSMIRSRYAALLPQASTRAEVSDIIREMLAELGKSHISERAGEPGPRPAPDLMPGRLGADFVWDSAVNGYRCIHIVCGDRWDAVRGGPLAKPGVNVAVGDVLYKINGIALTETMPPEKALLGCAGQEIALVWKVGLGVHSSVDDIAGAMQMLFLNDTHKAASAPQIASDARGSHVDPAVSRQPSSAKKKKKKKGGTGQDELSQKPALGREHCVTVRAIARERYARYVDEVVSRRLYVHTSTKDRVGYIHLPDCERLGFAEFHRHYLTESRRDGLVLDVRGNGGGHISDLLLEKV